MITAKPTEDFNDDWGYEVSYQKTSLTEDGLLNNDVSDTRFRQAVLTNDAGTACADTGGGCAPLNIFGLGTITDAAIGFINVGAANVTKIDTEIINATVNGRFGGIGDAGPIGIAVGFERRDDESAFRPDEFLAGGDVLGFNSSEETIGGYDVTEFFGEIDVPLLSGVTGAESLSLWAAYRSSDYSNLASTVDSYATALNWAPIEQVRFRAGYQRAVRAPNVAELFGGQGNGFPGATDPCSVDGSALGTVPGDPVYEICLAQGVTAANIGVFTQANTQIEGLFGGNPNLQEETADTYTYGVVVQPIDSLDITIDYFDIEVEDAIFVLGGGLSNTLDICYNQIQDINSVFCTVITRRGDNIDNVKILNENIGGLATTGIDLAINWVTDFDAGFFGEGSTLAVSLRSTFLDKADIKPVSDLSLVNTCGGQFGNNICGEPRPDNMTNTRITWVNGPLTVSLLWRYMAEVDHEDIENIGTPASTLSNPTHSAQNYVDLSGAYQVTDSFRLNLGFKNILDEEPDFLGDAQNEANTYPESYDIIGPRIFISGSYAWQ